MKNQLIKTKVLTKINNSLYLEMPEEIVNHLQVKEGDKINWCAMGRGFFENYLEVHKVLPPRIKPIPITQSQGGKLEDKE